MIAAWAAALGALCSCGDPPTLKRTRGLLRQGKLADACSAAERLIDGRDAGRDERLAAVRSWIECLARAGRLKQAGGWLDRQAPALRAYGGAMAQVARSPQRLEGAVKLLARAARAWPREAEPAYRAGLLLLADDQARRALPWLQRACRVAERAACRVAEAHARLDLGQIDGALAAARRAAALDPTPADLRRGRALIRRLARRRRRVPKPAAPRYRRALDQLLRQQRPSPAVAAAQELLLDHADLPALHTLLGLAQLQLGNTVEAVVALRRAATLDRTDPINHFYLGTIFESRGRWARCVERYRATLRFDPFNQRATAALARALHRTGQPEEAARVLDRLVVLEGRSERSLRLAGRAHLAARSFDKAMAHFQRLLGQTPRDFEAHLRLAQTMLELYGAAGGDREPELLERARGHAVHAAEINPRDPELRKLELRLERYAQ